MSKEITKDNYNRKSLKFVRKKKIYFGVSGWFPQNLGSLWLTTKTPYSQMVTLRFTAPFFYKKLWGIFNAPHLTKMGNIQCPPSY